MTIRCVFHVSPALSKSEPVRRPAESYLDIEVTVVEEAPVRGRSFETWSRARGWASED